MPEGSDLPVDRNIDSKYDQLIAILSKKINKDEDGDEKQEIDLKAILSRLNDVILNLSEKYHSQIDEHPSLLEDNEDYGNDSGYILKRTRKYLHGSECRLC